MQRLATALLLALAAGLPACSRPDAGDPHAAWAMAQQFVESRLASPSTASFGAFGEQPARNCVVPFASASEYTVTGWVDAQNGLGAVVRSHFTCQLRYLGGGKWECVSLTIS